MAVSAKIKFTQGGLDPLPGIALVGTTGTPVVCTNEDNSNVETFEWEVIDKPPTSAVPGGIVAVGPVSSFVFSPDQPGGYHLHLTTTDLAGNKAEDFRVFQVPEASGYLIPPFDALAPALNFGGSSRGWAKSQEELLRYLLANIGGGGGIPVVELAIAAGVVDTDSASYTRVGGRVVDMSNFPATLGALARQVRFKAVIENSLHSASWNARVRLFDVTNIVEVTGTVLENDGEPDRSVPTEFDSGLLTVGSGAGNIRSDAPALYESQISVVGASTPPGDRAILSNARLEILYV